jgi:hypothetical protein
MARVEKTLNYSKISATSEMEYTHVMIGSSVATVNKALAKERLRLLNLGHMITEDNGDRVWRERHLVMERGRYIYHDDGDRIRVQIKEVIMHADSDCERQTRDVRLVWGNDHVL